MNAHHSVQLGLFDSIGALQPPPIQGSMAKAAPWNSGADLEVEGMLFRFLDELEPEATIDAVLSALIDVHHRPKNQIARMMQSREVLEVEPWATDMFVRVATRDKLDSGVIYVGLYEGTLALALPDSSLWEDRGLGWLTTYLPCCKRNRDNLSPWLGRTCGCIPC